MVETIRIGSIEARPGEKSHGYFKVAESPDGNALNAPVILVNGSAEGPTLVVQSTADGAELNGIEIIRRVTASLDPKQLRGRLIAIPIVNVHAFLFRERRSPIDQLSLRYPGNPTGWLTERIANTLHTQVVSHGDVLIDLHGGGRDLEDMPMVIWSDDEGERQEMVDSIAVAFGVKLCLRLKQRGDKPPSKKVGRIVPELGEHGFQEEYIRIGVRGIGNVMKYLKMVDGEIERPQEQYVLTERTRMTATHAGLVRREVKVGQNVEKGQLLSRIMDPFGNDLELFHAPADGVIMSAVNYPVVYTGDWVISVAHFSSRIELP